MFSSIHANEKPSPFSVRVSSENHESTYPYVYGVQGIITVFQMNLLDGRNLEKGFVSDCKRTMHFC